MALITNDFKNEAGHWSKGYSVCGVQYQTRSYKLWGAMLSRCNPNAARMKAFPTYAGCTMSDNFKDYLYFAEWCNKQVGYGLDGYHLDKDILFKGNKVYSEESCVFVPGSVNMLLTKRRNGRGALPIGVSAQYGKKYSYIATCNKEGRATWLGGFDDIEQAFMAYKNFKEAAIKEAATHFKEYIDARTYEALLAYQVEITD